MNEEVTLKKKKEPETEELFLANTANFFFPERVAVASLYPGKRKTSSGHSGVSHQQVALEVQLKRSLSTLALQSHDHLFFLPYFNVNVPPHCSTCALYCCVSEGGKEEQGLIV